MLIPTIVPNMWFVDSLAAIVIAKAEEIKTRWHADVIIYVENAQDDYRSLFALIGVNGTLIHIFKTRSQCYRIFGEGDLSQVTGEDNDILGRNNVLKIQLTELYSHLELLYVLTRL